MNCRKCGHALDSKAKICPFCGENLYNIEIREKAIFDECAKALAEDQQNEIEIEEKKPQKQENVKTRKAKMNDTKIEVAATESVPDEEEYETKKKWSPWPLISGILITLVLIGCAAFAGYYAYNHFIGQSTDTYIKSLSTLNDKINTANGDVVNILKSNQKELPVSELIAQMPKTFDTFNSIIESHNGISTPSIYSEANKTLDEAITVNKAIYQNLQNILKNPADSQAQQNLSQLSQQIDKCMNLYTSLKVEGVNFSLPNEVISISSRVEPWAKQKQADYAQVMTLITGYTKYFDNMAKLFVNYDAAKADFNATLKNVRSGISKWDDLFAQLDNSEKALKAIQTDYTKQTVPVELRTINKGFAPILDESLLYISKFRFAAQTEKDFKKDGLTPDQVTLKTTAINNLYQEAEKNNASSLLNYQKYASDLKGEKDRYLDPEYVLKLKGKK